MLDTVYTQIGAVFVIGVCGFALWQGDGSERAGGFAALIAWLASILVQDETSLMQRQVSVFAIDIILLAVFIAAAWKSPRSWPVWAAGFQLIGVAAHLTAFFDLRIQAIAYLTSLVIASYGVLGALAFGTWQAWREREALRGLR